MPDNKTEHQLQEVVVNDMDSEDILEKIVHEEDKETRAIMARQISITKSGPLPDADEFHKYEKAVPGAGDRILTMAENMHHSKIELMQKEQEHFHKNNFVLSFSGIIVSTIISLSGIVGSVILGIYGQSWASGIIGVLSLGSIIANILRVPDKQDKEE